MKSLFWGAGVLLLAATALTAQTPALYRPVIGEPIALEADVTRLHPDALIIREGHYTEKDGRFELAHDVSLAPPQVWIERSGNWIEPASAVEPSQRLLVGPDEMILTEVHGDVTIVLPEANNQELRGTNGLQVPAGAIITTGRGASAAVLMGGVNSIRFIGGSEARISQSIQDGLRNTTVSLTQGGVFSRVGQRLNEKQSFQVKTPFGIAAAKGTDFVTLCLPKRMDVWIAQGTVQLNDASGATVGTVSPQPGALKILRTPVITEDQSAAQADSETMGMAVDVIPTLNLKTATITQKDFSVLTDGEKTFLGDIRRFTWLVKAEKVEALPAPESASPASPAPPALPPAPTPAENPQGLVP
jgi:FecR protein